MLCFPDGTHSHSIVNSFDWERTSSYQGWIQDLLKGVHTNGAPVNFQLIKKLFMNVVIFAPAHQNCENIMNYSYLDLNGLSKSKK